MNSVPRLDTSDPDFAERFDRLVAQESQASDEIDARVREIVDQVRERGDDALLEYTRRFDGVAAQSVAELLVSPNALEEAYASIGDAARDALEQAAGRIRAYHEHQLGQEWSLEEADGTVLGQRITALDRVGLYVPGGKAAYPSSVLMNAIPAKVAGVRELVMVVPALDGEVDPLVLAAAKVAGVDTIINVGGAQAVAALAYGTQTIARVDKIVGPGNAYVAGAKRIVFGAVGIDMIAGPSEIAIICDGKTSPQWIAYDMFAQSEHDEQARALLLSPDGAFIGQVADAMDELLPEMPRAAVIEASLSGNGALIKVRDLEQAVELVNRIAPEHLELSVAHPRELLAKVQHAGAIFLGRYSAEAFGDYCAGPNHVLPTGGTARFSSPLGVYDFEKRSSIIDCSAEGARSLAPIAAELARGEGLHAHALSVLARSK